MSDSEAPKPEIPYDIQHKPSFTENPYGGDLEWAKRKLIGPSVAYIEVDDTLLLESWAVVPPQTINLSVRVLRADGVIVPLLAQLVVATQSATAATKLQGGVAGFILSASIECAAAKRGFVYCRLSIQRGTGTQDVTRGQVLAAGYPDTFTSLAYPQDGILPALSGMGAFTTSLVGNPAAGAEWSFTTAVNQHLLLQGARFVLTTSVAVANRRPRIQVVDPAGNITCDIVASTDIPASVAAVLDFHAGNTQNIISGAVTVLNMGFPRNMRVNAGSTVRSNTINIQAADQYSLICINQEFWNGL